MTPSDGPVIGILGGMGPQATVALMQRVIDLTPARDDGDHVHMIIDNNPQVPSRIAALIEGTGESPAPVLAAMAKGLEAAGVDALAMACNTAHAYGDTITGAVNVAFLDMISLTCDQLCAQWPAGTRVGLLASPAVAGLGLYSRALGKRGFEVFCPDEAQARLFDIIKTVKTNNRSNKTGAAFATVARQVMTARADVLLVACTELSVLTGSLDADTPFVDALDVLAQGIVSFAKRKIS